MTTPNLTTDPSKYTPQYFIDKFKAIPEEQWCTGLYSGTEGKHCALGHCGVRSSCDVEASDHDVSTTDESRGIHALRDTNGRVIDIIGINDGDYKTYSQSTPRARMLAALIDIRDRDNKENDDDNDGS